MPLTCFSYPADVPPDVSDHGGAKAASPGTRRMTYSTCFRYQAGTDPGDMPPARPSPHRMTSTTCFRY
jgi:hypothetical protein